jgi:hypothetical protein
VLDESGRRRFGAAEALAAGRGGVTAVMRATGLAWRQQWLTREIMEGRTAKTGR